MCSQEMYQGTRRVPISELKFKLKLWLVEPDLGGASAPVLRRGVEIATFVTFDKMSTSKFADVYSDVLRM